MILLYSVEPSAAATADHGIIFSMTMAGEDGTSEASTKTNESGASTQTSHRDNSEDEQRPALPPRPIALQPPPRPSSPQSRVSRTTSTTRPQLQSQPTIALSSIDIQTLSFPDGSRGTFPVNSDHSNAASVSGSRKLGQKGSEIDDSASLTSYTPSLRVGGDLESLLGNGFNTQSPAWRLLNSQADSEVPFETIEFDDDDDRLSTFEHEFDEVADVNSKEGNEG